MRGPQYIVAYFSAAVGFSCTLGILATDADAPVSAASLSSGIETESNSLASFGDNGWSTAGPAVEDENSNFPFSDDAPHDVSSLHDATFRSASGDTNVALPEEYVLETEGAQTDLSSPESPHKSSKRRRRRHLASFSTAFLAFVVYLGLMTLRYKKASPASQQVGSPQVRPKQRHQDGDTVTAEQLLQSMDELKKLQPLAAELAEMVGTDKSRSALKDFLSTLQRSKDIDQMTVGDHAGSPGSPLAAVKTAIEDSVSALSRLYEVARGKGLSLAQEIQKERPPVFSEEEMRVLEDGLGTCFREFMDLREQNLKSSFPIFVQQAEKAAAELKGLRGLEGAGDLHLLVAATANLEMLKVACDALQIEFKCSDSIKGNAGAVLHMQYQRGHASIHRDLTGRLGELRILCILERQRQQNLPQQDVSVLEALDWLEDQLNRCEQQLQKHKEMMERMEEEDDILFASNLEQQARTIADNLSALLKAVANRRSSIPGALSEEEAAQSEAMQGHLKVVAYRAIGEAAAAGGRAVGMLKSAEEQRPGDSTLPWSQQAEGSKLSQLPRLRSTDVAQMISAMLKQFENVHAAMRKPVHAKEQTQERRSSSDALIEELLRASRTAAETSAAFLNEAQFMWLHAQLNASLELDMQLSATLAQRATAAVGMAAGEQPKQQHWHVEVPAVDIQVFENLLEQFKNVEEDAQSATALNQMALAATRMKQAALKLTMFVDERQKQPR